MGTITACKNDYIAISANNIKNFNEQLKSYIGDGWTPSGSIAIAIGITSTEKEKEYSILLCKTYEVEIKRVG